MELLLWAAAVVKVCGGGGGERKGEEVSKEDFGHEKNRER